jgi:hypothetical protein
MATAVAALVVFLIICCCAATAHEQQQHDADDGDRREQPVIGTSTLKVVYGSDTRKNENDASGQLTSVMKTAGKATVMLVQKANLQKSGDYYNIASQVRTTVSTKGAKQCTGDAWPFPDEKILGARWQAAANLVALSLPVSLCPCVPASPASPVSLCPCVPVSLSLSLGMPDSALLLGLRSRCIAGYCSGTLVNSRYIATAGHCVPNRVKCADTYIVFGATNAQVKQNRFPAASVFLCDDEAFANDADVATSFNQNAHGYYDSIAMYSVLHYGLGWAAKVDFALLKLDRGASGYTPVTVNTETKLSLGDSVFAAGHPRGLPRKYTEAQVNFVGPVLPSGG